MDTLELILIVLAISFWVIFPIGMFIAVRKVEDLKVEIVKSKNPFKSFRKWLRAS